MGQKKKKGIRSELLKIRNIERKFLFGDIFFYFTPCLKLDKVELVHFRMIHIGDWQKKKKKKP